MNTIKKLLVLQAALFFCTAGVHAADLLEYPPIINNGDILINTGIGIGPALNSGYGIFIPPILVSADFAVPVGTLPVTLGLGAAFSGEKNGGGTVAYNIGISGRLAYHFNFPFGTNPFTRRFDPYAFITLGGVVETEGDKGDFWGGFGIGARYLVKPFFGVYVEGGLSFLSMISTGAVFRI